MSDNELGVEEMLRLAVVEMVLEHLVTTFLFSADTQSSEHFKNTLIESASRIDRKSVKGPVEIDALEGGAGLQALQLKMAEFLSRVESVEHEARQQSRSAQVELVANKLFSELLGKPSPYDPL